MATSAATGTYTITVIGTGGTEAHTAAVSLTITPAVAANFTISASPASVSVARGGNGTSKITTTVSGGFNSPIALSATGQPAGVNVTFGPPSIPGAGTSTMTITTPHNTAPGSYTITVKGTSGATTRTASVFLTVRN